MEAWKGEKYDWGADAVQMDRFKEIPTKIYDGVQKFMDIFIFFWLKKEMITMP